MDSRKSFVIFSGSNDRAVLAFLRALSICGHRAYIVARTRADRVLRTHFARDVVFVRDTADLTIEIFLQCIEQVRQTACDGELVILPSSEYLNNFLLQHRDQIENTGCNIPLVDATTYNLLTAKRSATTFFASGGITVPTEYDHPESRKLPLVAKPLRNIDEQGKSLYPALLHTREDLQKFAAANIAEDYFFQEYIQGESRYLLVYISRDSKQVRTWSHRNLMQQPCGKSMLFAAPDNLHDEPVAQRIIEQLHALKFTGLGMIELIRDDSRTVFIEMNPRVWGPVQFCLDQHQPLLQAFIGECLHGDPLLYTTKLGTRKRSYYFWLGGVLDTIASRRRPTWHTSRISWLKLIRIGMQNDVFLRIDSWRYFLYEIASSLSKAIHVKRN